MQTIVHSRILSSLIFVFLLFMPFASIADAAYVYCGADRSNIMEVISQLSDLDNNGNSPLHRLQEYVTNESCMVEYEALVETLAYAEQFLQKNKHSSKNK